MYEEYWGLSNCPFANTNNIRWFFNSPVHEEALARLFFLIEHRRSCGLLRGPAGVGKTLLQHVLLHQVQRSQRQAAMLDVSGFDGRDLIWALAEELHLSLRKPRTDRSVWQDVRDHFICQRTAQIQTVLIFDHAERAQDNCLDAIHRLLNIDSGSAPWITTIVAARHEGPLPAGPLSAIDELSDLRVELAPFAFDETADYVRHLLFAAGCDRPIFAESAIEALQHYSAGVPRTINRLCDLSLLAALGEQCETIDADIISTVALELQLTTREERFTLLENLN